MSEKNTSDAKITHTNIFAALSAFQGELKPLKRSGRVQFNTRDGKTVDFNYTPLSEIMEAIYPILAKHGLSVRHEIVRGGTLGTKEGIEAILTHETYKTTEMKTEKILANSEGDHIGVRSRELFSHKIENELRSGVIFIAQGSDMKDTGSAITYARRYSLTMVLGISSEDDNDAKLLEERGQAAMSFAYNKAKQGIQGAKTAPELEKATKVLQDDLRKLENGKAGALGLSEEQYKELIKLAEDKKVELEKDGKNDK